MNIEMEKHETSVNFDVIINPVLEVQTLGLEQSCVDYDVNSISCVIL